MKAGSVTLGDVTTILEGHMIYPIPGPQPGPTPAGLGRLVVDCSYLSGGNLQLAATGTKIQLNGQVNFANWGPWPIDVPAGTYHLRVCTRYLGEMGPAELMVAVYPGQVTTVYYTAPATTFSRGVIGFWPQHTNGMGALIAIIVVCVVLNLVGAVLILAA